MDFNILDCTLRDGGYYTNWDFDWALVEGYSRAMERLPVTYVEIGYRSIPLKGYLGEYFYCPDHVMRELKALMPSKKLAIILNEKDIRKEVVKDLLTPAIPYISLIRIAVDPKNFERAITLAKAIKEMGFEVAFNVMYMSNWKEDNRFLDLLNGMDDVIDFFYMVDSFGGIIPDDIKEIIALVRSKTSVKLGFHGHNNLEMALINTITALEQGCVMVDATVTGMGRGAGNLRTELLMTYLKSKDILDVKFSPLSNVVASFEDLKRNYGWGTNMPYMFSGAFSLPQKQVMEWVGMNRYPLVNIINALNNQKESLEDNIELSKLSADVDIDSAIILGGGPSTINHISAIKQLAAKSSNLCLIHAGVRNVTAYSEIENKQYYALAGFESEKLLLGTRDISELKHTCVYPPYPRKMGTVIPDSLKKISVELKAITFTNASSDSPLAIAIQTALDLGINKLFMAGFDGYDATINQVQFKLAQENQNILKDAAKLKGVQITFVTPTRYRNVQSTSIYSLI